MASRDYLVDINMRQNELKNVVLDKRVEHPEDPVQGQIYFNTKTLDVFVFTGKEWISLSKTFTIDK